MEDENFDEKKNLENNGSIISFINFMGNSYRKRIKDAINL